MKLTLHKFHKDWVEPHAMEKVLLITGASIMASATVEGPE